MRKVDTRKIAIATRKRWLPSPGASGDVYEVLASKVSEPYTLTLKP